MRARHLARALALALAVACALSVPGAAGAASRTVTLPGWLDHQLAFSGRHLVVAEAATVRVDPRLIEGAPRSAAPFDYYRAEARRVALTPARTRFAGPVEPLVAIRTSIARMRTGVLAPGGGGTFAFAPATAGGAPPVTWCCDGDGAEVVVESDGRPDAPVAVAAAVDGRRVRHLLARPAGPWTLVGTDPVGLGERRTEAPVGVTATPATVAMAAGLLAWADPSAPAVLRTGTPGDGGLAPGREVPLPGTAVRVWAAPGIVAAAVRRGPRVLVVRVDPAGGSARVVWSGRRVPRVAVGGGAVAVADGRRVLAGRGGLRLVRRSRGPVAAVAVDGRRVAWVERARARGARVSVARLGVVR